MELIEKDLDFAKELEEFESSFEWDELLDIYIFCRIESIFVLIFLEKIKQFTIYEIRKLLIPIA
jgi:hypothetical protein